MSITKQFFSADADFFLNNKNITIKIEKLDRERSACKITFEVNDS